MTDDPEAARSSSGNWLDALERAGLQLAETGPGEVLVTGNTYAHKEMLKRAGGRWSGSRQGWAFSERAHLQQVAAALANGTAPVAQALREAPAGYDADDRGQARKRKKRYHGHRERLRSRFLEAGSASLPDYELLELLLFYAIEVRDTKDLAKDLIATFGSLGGVLAAEEGRVQEVMGQLAGLEPASGAYHDWLRYWRSPQYEVDAEALAAGGRPLDEAATALRAFQGSPEWQRDGDRYWAFRFTTILLKVVREVAERVRREEIADRPVIGSWNALIDYLKTALAHEPIEQFRVLFLDRKNVLIRDEVQQRGTVDHTPLYPREVVRRALELQASALIMVHNHPSGDPTPSRADVEMTRQVVAALTPVGVTLHDHVIVGKNRHTSFKTQQLI